MPEQLKPKQTAIEHFLDVNNNSPILSALKGFRKRNQPKTLEPGAEIVLKPIPESSPKASESLPKNLKEKNEVKLFDSKQYLDDIYSIFESNFADIVDLTALKFKLNLIKNEENFQIKTKAEIKEIVSDVVDHYNLNKADIMVLNWAYSDLKAAKKQNN